MTEQLTLGEKLDQRRFSGMSDKMAALVAYIVPEVPYEVEPAIVGLTVSSDRFVFATNVDGTGTLIGTLDDFVGNWDKLIVAAELTIDEEIEVRESLMTKVQRPPYGVVGSLREAWTAAKHRRDGTEDPFTTYLRSQPSHSAQGIATND